MSANIHFSIIRWNEVEKQEHPGAKSTSHWQTMQWDGLRVRIVEYLPGYLADHWCHKGHIVHCLEGSFITEMEDGGQYEMEAGMSYVVSDDLSSHRSYSKNGVKLLIVDGAFLGKGAL
jgi:hypothetical protein